MLEAPGAAEYGEHGVARVFCRGGECGEEFVLRAGDVKGVLRASTSKQWSGRRALWPGLVDDACQAGPM